MKRCLRGLILAGFIFMSVCIVQAAQQEPAPDFQLEVLHGSTLSLSAYKDKEPVILFFWTTWCPFCRKELAQLNDMYPQFKKDGVELLAVNANEDGMKVSNYVTAHNIKIKVLLDKDGFTASSYGVMGVPTYIFIDKSGNIVLRENTFPKDSYKKFIAK